ncbi:hypothetical protein EVAR_52993_1 [Eumeta japonica]|uniref:Uncharacterized protein n=1 Tax=Eumeta variegata TaxID=151549 RepID=A0A4C1YIZ0_EUMVA|nr:hypothetical protein EVAR_52993_1 [Eumeta japonica]
MKPGFVNTNRNLNRSPCNGRKKRKAAEEIQRFKVGIEAYGDNFWDSEGVLLIDYLQRDYYEWPILRGIYWLRHEAVVQKRRGKLSRGVLFYKTMHLPTRRGFRGRP